jgi:hypothetical protein
MKTGTAVCAIAGLLFISVVLLDAFGGASAQSGRIIPKPKAAVPAESPKQPEAKPKFVPDPDADKFKLVFPISYGKRLYKDPPTNRKEKKEREKEIERVDENKSVSYRNSFIDELNKAGEQGYRLTALGSPLIAIVRLGAVQYEYAWFEITSDFFFYRIFKIGLREKYEQLAGQGYSVVDRNYLGSVCKSPPADAISPFESCIHRDLYILEREKGFETPSQFKHVWHEPSWRQLSADAPLTIQINEFMALGFNPILALSKCEVLLQRNTDKGEFLPEGTEVKVVTGNVKKKVNELAQQGYRLALIHNQVAVMRRSRDTTAPVSYVWLDSWKKKSFEPELARLQGSGAIYRMTYPDGDGYEYTLIFEQPTVEAGKRREYKVLKVEFQEAENFEDQRMDIDLTPSSKETIKTLNSLVKEGFVVRDLFVSDDFPPKRANVLLERTL